MQIENDIFLFHEADNQLFCRGRNGEFAPLTAKLLEQEMRYSKSRTRLHIHCLTQDGLEYFASNLGAQCRVLFLEDCRHIHDLSPLSKLQKLKALCLDDCRKAASLWDISNNTSLEILSIRNSKQLIFDPLPLQTAPALREIRLWGGNLTAHTLKSLVCFRGIRSLERIDLNMIRLEDHDLSALSALPNLLEFHFDAGMLTTEEIAYICAKYPSLYGDCLRAYTPNDPFSTSGIRICGSRKPSLHLPKDQNRLDKYIAQFDALVEKYRLPY